MSKLFMMSRRALLAAGVATVSTPARSQAWPDRPIRIIVPFAAGGPTDVAARLVANGLQGQNIPTVVENRPGAGVMIGTQALLAAPRDGYTFLLTTIAHAVLPAVVARVPFDAQRDFTGVALIGTVPLVAITNRDFPANNLAGFLAEARRRRLLYGSAGIGSAQHLASELLKARAGVDIEHIPYRGAGPAVTDLMGGAIHLVFDGVSSAMPQIRSGKVKALAVSTATRVAALPEIATVAETAAGYDAYTFNLLVAGSGTPSTVVQSMSRAVNVALAEPRAAAIFAELGVVVPQAASNTPADADRFLASEIAKWPPVLAAAGVRPE